MLLLHSFLPLLDHSVACPSLVAWAFHVTLFAPSSGRKADLCDWVRSDVAVKKFTFPKKVKCPSLWTFLSTVTKDWPDIPGRRKLSMTALRNTKLARRKVKMEVLKKKTVVVDIGNGKNRGATAMVGRYPTITKTGATCL